MKFKDMFREVINKESIENLTEEEKYVQESIEKTMKSGKCYVCKSPLKYKLFKGEPPLVACFCTNKTTGKCVFAKNRMYYATPQYKDFSVFKGGVTSQKLLNKEI